MKIQTTGYKLEKKDLPKLYKVLAEFGEVIAPTINENFVRMMPVENFDNVLWTGLSWFTSKKYVFPETQQLFSFCGEKINNKIPEPPKRVLFNLRMCDLNAFAINDKLFQDQKTQMEFYKKFRENLLLVGLWCNKPVDKLCFCDSMNLQPDFDICLFDREDYFHIKTNSKKGKEIIQKLNLPTDELKPQEPDCKTKLKTTDIKDLFDKNEIWHKGEKDCITCGACTNLCPTCLCFDIEDETELNGKCGKRCSKWDSCMYKDFTQVAGGHHFRGDRVDRFKHRIYHKLEYFEKQFGRSMCTGCGRCIRACPTNIDWVKLINENV